MRHFFPFFFLLAVLRCVPLMAQTVIARQNFEAAPASPVVATTNAGGALYSGLSAATGNLPAASPFYSEGAQAYGVTNGTATITSAVINAAAFSNVAVSFRLAAFSLTNSDGLDANDYVKLEISTNGGTSWSSEVIVNGNNDAYWSYVGGANTATRSYGGTITPVTFAPTGGGSRTTDGYGTVRVTGVPASSQLQFRITLNDNNNERWVVDDVQVQGAPVSVTSFTPTSGSVGSPVTITGTNFTGATSVRFNGVSAAYTVVSATTITATVPVGATTGPITVVAPLGTGISATSFTVVLPPTITSFTPITGPTGTVVTITGTNLTGATGVTFNLTAASVFSVNSATQITATVPVGATTGAISVVTPGGTATSSTSFTVIPAPAITSFTPVIGGIGTVVTINGGNFTGATDVKFNTTSAVTYTVVSSTQITATVPVGATTGTIKVTTPGGTATSATSFTVVPLPTITSFTPTSGVTGNSVVITGTNFTSATGVSFNGTSATFTVNSATSITTTVPAGTSNGPISVTNPAGTATSTVSFILTTITTGAVTLSNPCISSTGLAVNVPFTTTGTFATGGGPNGNTFRAQLSNATGSFANPVLIGSGATSPISATIPSTSLSGSGYRIRVVATNPVTTGTNNGSNLTLLSYQDNEVLSYTATAANNQVTLNWTIPASCFDQLIIIARASASVTARPRNNITANSTFGAGTNVGNGGAPQYVVYAGVSTVVTVTGLTNGVSYCFKAYVRRGTNYSNGSEQCATPLSVATITEVIMPQLIVGHTTGGTTHADRLPYAFRVSLSGLTPSASYRYYNRAVENADAANSTGAGTPIYVTTAGAFVRAITPGLSAAGAYGTFTTNASGVYMGWFVLEPTADARFDHGNTLRMRLYLNNGAGGTAVTTYLTTPTPVEVRQLAGQVAYATGIYGLSLAPASNFVVLYDNVGGTGRPVAATLVESDGVAQTAANGYVGFYSTKVNGVAGAWGVGIPNDNSNGVRRVEQRALTDGSLVGCAATDADGIWPSGTNTVAPEGETGGLQLTTLDAPLTCTTLVGFNPNTVEVQEGDVGTTTVTFKVTMNQRPTGGPVTVTVTDAGTGTATAITDYTFSTQTLTFPATNTYPQTFTATIVVKGDVTLEANETINLGLTVTNGSATVINSPATLTIKDDEAYKPGLFVNEFSLGPGSNQDFVELLVSGQPGTTMDLRGWVFDDNNGDFSAGSRTNTGVSSGHIRFSNTCTWEKVPVGTLIVFYNATNKNPRVPADDPTDANLDHVYVIPLTDPVTCPPSNTGLAYYFEGNCTSPSTSIGSYGAATTGPQWAQVKFDRDDAMQTRRPPLIAGGQPTYFHGVSFSQGSTNVTAARHPDFALMGANTTYFSGNFKNFHFDNSFTNDFRDKRNWFSETGVNNEAPGLGNTPENAAFIETLRTPLGVTTTTKSYTCVLRPLQDRVFIDDENKVIMRVKNNGTTDHEDFTAETIVNASSRNANLEGQPFFMAKQFRATPFVSSPANYTITFYVTNAELQAYASYVSAQTGFPYTATILAANMKVYKTGGEILPSTAMTNAEVVISPAVRGTYGAAVTTFSASFSSFSSFALGLETTTVLPVELVSFTAHSLSKAVRLDWKTASEQNNDRFEVQRSADGLTFEQVGTVRGAGTTPTPRSYTFLDVQPLPGVAYYRLRQVDGSGAAIMSQIVTGQRDSKVTSLPTMEASPVPFDNELTLRLTSITSGPATVQLVDMLGRSVLMSQQTINIGANALILATGQVTAGSYVALVHTADGKLFRVHVLK